MGVTSSAIETTNSNCSSDMPIPASRPNKAFYKPKTLLQPSLDSKVMNLRFMNFCTQASNPPWGESHIRS